MNPIEKQDYEILKSLTGESVFVLQASGSYHSETSLHGCGF